MEEQTQKHKSGFVNIIGNPNVGKSTLMNALVGQNLSIITSKAQTTRHRILGIVSGDNFQVVLSDTPGIIKPAYKLQESMMDFVKSAFEDADILLFLVEPGQKELKDESFYRQIENSKVPVFLIINKIDTIDQSTLEQTVAYWTEKLPCVEVCPISAKEKFNVSNLMDRIVEVLPEGPAYYPKDTLTDKPERFFVNEIIRQKILLNYNKEVPYSVEVETESFTEEEDIIRIRAVIYVERTSQRPIIIGHKGEAIKRVGTQARIDMEKFFGKKVFLETFVKVSDGWRSDDRSLRRFGYEQ
ncbi:MAG: GTPase Era [Flavobacteriales bacterium]|nr:GTPase Era [Flavobacteriales bacterium]